MPLLYVNVACCTVTDAKMSLPKTNFSLGRQNKVTMNFDSDPYTEVYAYVVFCGLFTDASSCCRSLY